MLRLTLAALHILALGIGLGAVVARGAALREPPGAAALRRVFRADALWGIAAVIWLTTGLWRLFGQTEKSIGYYMQNHVFFTKMGLFLAIIALEIWPMMMLVRWRIALGRGADAAALMDPRNSRRIATISHLEALLVVLIVFAAVAMARGIGMVG